MITPSCPALCRGIRDLLCFKKDVDGRDKPGTTK